MKTDCYYQFCLDSNMLLARSKSAGLFSRTNKVPSFVRMEDGTGPPAFEFRSCSTLLQGEKPLVKLATRTGAGSTLVAWAYDGLIGKPDVGGSWLAKESCLVLNWLMLVLAKANLALSSSDYMLEISSCVLISQTRALPPVSW
jgi:hypothetical protein